jgi:hypothetical protein
MFSSHVLYDIYDITLLSVGVSIQSCIYIDRCNRTQRVRMQVQREASSALNPSDNSDMGRWEWSFTVTEFTSSVLAPTVPTARGIGPKRISEKVEPIFEEVTRVLHAREFSRMSPRNASSTCYVRYERLIQLYSIFRQVRSALRFTTHFSLRH